MNKIIQRADKTLAMLKFADALDLYQEVILKEPSNALSYQGAAYCLYNLKRYDDALEFSKKALALDLNLILPHVIFAYIFHTQGHIEKSLEEAEVALKAGPKSPDALCCYGTLLLSDEKFDDAEKYLYAAISIEPQSYLALYNLSIIYTHKKDAKNFIKVCLQLFRIKSNLKNLIRLAVAFLGFNRLTPLLWAYAIPFFAALFNLQFLLYIPIFISIIYIFYAYFWIIDKQIRSNNIRRSILILTPTLLAYIYLFPGLK